MKKNSIEHCALLLLLLLMLTGCSSDDDNTVVVNRNQIVGQWLVSHHSKNPNYGDYGDMWLFTFNADGTGTWPLGTGTFTYEVNGNRVHVRLTDTYAYYGQTEFDFIIVSCSETQMEWDEIPNEYWGNDGMYLKLYRQDEEKYFVFCHVGNK